MQPDDGGRVGCGRIPAAAGGNVGVEFRGSDRCKEGGVGAGDGDAVGGCEEVQDAVEAFGGELVVGKGAEELGDEDVD